MSRFPCAVAGEAMDRRLLLRISIYGVNRFDTPIHLYTLRTLSWPISQREDRVAGIRMTMKLW